MNRIQLISTLLAFCSIFTPICLRAGGEADGIKVLQWNVWQEGTMVKGGYDAIVHEIVKMKPDFVTLSEVRNYHGRDFITRLRKDLQTKGLTYYGFSSYDSGLLSLHPITDSLTVYPEKDDHGSIYGLRCEVGGRKYAVYTAHLDYLDCSYYNVRGYDGSTWKEVPIAKTAEEVIERSLKSKRLDAINAFLKEAAKDSIEGRTVILGGDFNEPSHLDWRENTRYTRDHHGLVVDWPVTSTLEKHGFTDSFREKWPDALTAPGFTFPADNPDVPEKKLTWTPLADERERIDFIFYRSPKKEVKLKECCVFGPKGDIYYERRVAGQGKECIILPDGVWPTDHKGLIATFSFR